MIMQIALQLAVALTPDSVSTGPRSLTTPPWYEAAISTGAEIFASRLSAWRVSTASVGYRGKKASHGIEAIVVSRFDRTNYAVAVDEAVQLGKGAYVAARGQFSPRSTVIARSDLSATLYQAVGTGWEVIPSLRIMTFPDVSVRILGVGGGRYTGLWYFSGRTSVAIQKGEQAVATTAQIRRYAADASPNFLNASASIGREVVVLAPGNTELQQTLSASLRGQKLLSHRIGLSIGISYEAINSLPDRRGLTLSSFVRW